MIGTALYLTRPQDVQAHLTFAAMEIGKVVLTLQGRQIYGTMGSPDPDTGRVPFEVDHQLADLIGAPPLGRAVRVTYEHRDSAYAFFSEIEESGGPLAWVLQRPSTVERTDRRLVTRLEVADEAGFEVHIGEGDLLRGYPLMDVSSAGVAYYYDPQMVPFQAGNRHSAELRIPGHAPINIILEIRNTRPDRQSGRGNIAGVSFVRLGAVERSQISKAIAQWKQANRR